MLSFLTLKPESFGLDISDLSLKIVKLKRKGKFFTLTSFWEERIPPGIIKGGEIRDEDSLAKIIKSALPKVKGKKLTTRHVVASLPEEKSFLQVIQMPKIPEEDLKSAVIYQAENYIPLPIEEVYLDSQIIPRLYPVRNDKNKDRTKKEQISNGVYNHLNHYDVLIAALPRKTVDPYLICLKKAGLLPKVLEIESLSIARALIKNEVSPFPELLIDLGATRTSFIIFSGYSLRFTSSIPVSSQKLTEAIAKALQLDLVKAEKIKLKYGIQTKEVFESLIPALTDLVEQIKKYLSYYQTHTSHEYLPSNGKGVEKIYLSGGGANLKGLTDFLSLELKIPVVLANPWVNIFPATQKETAELPYSESLKYTTALGLALRGVK